MAFNRRASRFMWGSSKGSPKGAAPVSSPVPTADQDPPPLASGAESGSVTGAAPRMTRRTSGLVAVACWRQGCPSIVSRAVGNEMLCPYHELAEDGVPVGDLIANLGTPDHIVEHTMAMKRFDTGCSSCSGRGCPVCCPVDAS